MSAQEAHIQPSETPYVPSADAPPFYDQDAESETRRLFVVPELTDIERLRVNEGLAFTFPQALRPEPETNDVVVPSEGAKELKKISISSNPLKRMPDPSRLVPGTPVHEQTEDSDPAKLELVGLPLEMGPKTKIGKLMSRVVLGKGAYDIAITETEPASNFPPSEEIIAKHNGKSAQRLARLNQIRLRERYDSKFGGNLRSSSPHVQGKYWDI